MFKLFAPIFTFGRFFKLRQKNNGLEEYRCLSDRDQELRKTVKGKDALIRIFPYIV
jgi:hypothetical protein